MIASKWQFPIGSLLTVALVLGADAVAQAQNGDQAQGSSSEEEGRVIQIAPDPGKKLRRREQQDPQFFAPGFPDQAQQEAGPSYWIGIIGGPIEPVIRHHLDIPEGAGLQVMEVVPESPAAEGGLEQHDIMLRANDIHLDEMQDLVELVITEGERKGQIALEVIRKGHSQTVWITPAERPAEMTRRGPQLRRRFGDGPPRGHRGGLQDLLGEMMGEDGFQFRNLGPGAFGGQPGRFQQQMNLRQMPDGTSVKVEKRGEQPPKITVERDGEVWEIEGDDPEALEALPEEIRPYVEQMLGQSPQFNLEGFDPEALGRMLPELEGMIQGRQGGTDFNERLHQMEHQMQEMHRQLRKPGNEKEDADEFH